MKSYVNVGGLIQTDAHFYPESMERFVKVNDLVFVGHQFKDRDGNWCFFINEAHEESTLKHGSWETRKIYSFKEGQQ